MAHEKGLQQDECVEPTKMKGVSPGAERRRLQDILVVCGTGIILFGAWTILKLVLLIVTHDEATQRVLLDIDDEIPLFLMYFMFGLIGIIDILFRCFVGFSARAEGYGRRKAYAYIPLAAFMVVMGVLSVVASAVALVRIDATRFDTISTLIIEATSVLIWATLIVSSVRLKRLDKASG